MTRHTDIIDDVQTERDGGSLTVTVVIDDESALEQARKDAALAGGSDPEAIAASNVESAVMRRLSEIDGAFDPDVSTTTYVVTDIETDLQSPPRSE